MGNPLRYQYEAGAAMETDLPGRRFFKMTRNAK